MAGRPEKEEKEVAALRNDAAETEDTPGPHPGCLFTAENKKGPGARPVLFPCESEEYHRMKFVKC